jgi:hypothetical protein
MLKIKGYIYMKLMCLYHGVYINTETLNVLQVLDTNFVQGLFSYHQNDIAYKLPHEFWFDNSVVVQLRFAYNSPCELYVVLEDIDAPPTFYIKCGNFCETRVTFPPCPTFYKANLCDGTPIYKVVQLAGKDCLKIYTSNYCDFERNSMICKFCTVDSSRKLQDVIHNKDTWQIRQAMKLAYAEGCYGHIMIATGTPPTSDRGLVFISGLLNDIRSDLKLKTISGSVSTIPPAEPKHIQTIYKSGIEYITFNLEVYDKTLFEKHCPGKAILIGREHYFESYKEAVAVFGKGRVRSNFVAGIEDFDSLSEGFEVMAQMGVVPTVTMLSLNERNIKTLGADFVLPSIEYYVEVFKRLEQIYTKYKLRPPWCSQCRTTSLEHEGAYL